MQKIELLAPAGDLERLKFAFMYGADACYIGGLNYSLRANANNFSKEELKEALEFAHSINKKVYVTINISFLNEDFVNLLEYLKFLEEIKVDAIIVSDVSIIDIVNNNKLNLKIHISTQSSLANKYAINFYKKQNVERVVLARELNKKEIKEIIDKCNIETEVFIHGAMCASYSGRCVLSNYFTNRDANRGGCAQVCRWDFEIENDKGKIENDTLFTMCSKDLSMIDKIDELIDLGVTSLKVEGRMRSNYYVATVINTYRSAIDDYYNNNLTKEKIKYYKKVLDKVANRDSTVQFFDKEPTKDEQYFLGRKEISNQDFLGVVVDYNEETNIALITQRNYFKKGDEIEIFGPNITTFNLKVDIMYDEQDNLITVANHPEQHIKLKINTKVFKNDIIRKKI